MRRKPDGAQKETRTSINACLRFFRRANYTLKLLQKEPFCSSFSLFL